MEAPSSHRPTVDPHGGPEAFKRARKRLRKTSVNEGKPPHPAKEHGPGHAEISVKDYVLSKSKLEQIFL